MHMTDTPARRRRRFTVKGVLAAALGVANAALLAALVFPGGVTPPAGDAPAELSLASLSPDFAAAANANALANQAGRPSEYLMIPARLTNLGQDIVYVIDTQNGDLTAAAYDRNNGIQFIAPLRLSQLFDQAAR